MSVYDTGMPAHLRLTLSDDEAFGLDEIRGAATRTAYATLLLQRSLRNGGSGGAELPEEKIQRILREELGALPDEDAIRRIVRDAIRDAAMGG